MGLKFNPKMQQEIEAALGNLIQLNEYFHNGVESKLSRYKINIDRQRNSAGEYRNRFGITTGIKQGYLSLMNHILVMLEEVEFFEGSRLSEVEISQRSFLKKGEYQIYEGVILEIRGTEKKLTIASDRSPEEILEFLGAATKHARVVLDNYLRDREEARKLTVPNASDPFLRLK